MNLETVVDRFVQELSLLSYQINHGKPGFIFMVRPLRDAEHVLFSVWLRYNFSQ
jgi:hypothetical protein